MPKETLLRQPSFLMRHRRRRNVGAPVWLPLRRPKDVYRLARLWRLSSNSAMSSTFTFSPPCVPAIPSVIMFKQNGQAVATVRAPVASASCARRQETRCTGDSSNHIRPPPAPQQKVFLPCRGIFAKLRVRSSTNHRAWCINFPVDASQVTRVMQGNRLAGTRAIAQASRSDQFCQQLRVMLHLVLAAELR